MGHEENFKIFMTNFVKYMHEYKEGNKMFLLLSLAVKSLGEFPFKSFANVT